MKKVETCYQFYTHLDISNLSKLT